MRSLHNKYNARTIMSSSTSNDDVYYTCSEEDDIDEKNTMGRRQQQQQQRGRQGGVPSFDDTTNSRSDTNDDYIISQCLSAPTTAAPPPTVNVAKLIVQQRRQRRGTLGASSHSPTNAASAKSSRFSSLFASKSGILSTTSNSLASSTRSGGTNIEEPCTSTNDNGGPPPSSPDNRNVPLGRIVNEAVPPATTTHSRRFRGFSTPFYGLFAHPASSAAASTATTEPPRSTFLIGGSSNGNQQQQQQQQSADAANEIRLSNMRTDICSLSCFGIFQSDYTRYLFTHVRPPTLYKRSCLHIVTPLALFVLAGWCSGHIRNSYANSMVCTALVYCVMLWIITSCYRGRKKRVMVREEMLWRLARRERRIAEKKNSSGGGGLIRRMIKNAVVASPTTTTNKLYYTAPTNEDNVNGGKTNNDNYDNIVTTSTSIERGRWVDGRSTSIEDDEDYIYYSEDEWEYHAKNYDTSLGQTRWEMNCAHRTLGCYPGEYYRDDDDNATADDIDDHDICTRIWKYIAYPCLPCIPCCNGGRGFHVQICGLCAYAQEGREVNITLPRHLRMIDYITMEPFITYYPHILELRTCAVSNFWEHWCALSELSKLILTTFKVILISLLILSISKWVGYWNISDMAVLFATFIQSFVVMYFVHWGWHRFDLSIDAVVKYFACGFVLCSSTVFTLEALGYALFMLSVMIVKNPTQVQDSGYGGVGGGMGGMKIMMDGSHRRYLRYFGVSGSSHGRSLTAESDVLDGYFIRHPMARIVYIFISCYLTTAIVEEICKYFAFIAVDHPDFCSEKELEKAKATLRFQLERDGEDDDDDDADETDDANGGSVPRIRTKLARRTNAATAFNPALQRRPLTSIRAGVTVAMVAVAMGYACAENLFDIFITNGWRPSIGSEIATLFFKSMFPIHPIAAAIQSVYVCRRDIEKDTSFGLGRIVMPSVIFHGTYDFALMAISSSWQKEDNYFYNQGGNDSRIAIASLCVSWFIMIVGVLYYMRISHVQYARLRGDCNGEHAMISEGSFALLV